MFAKFANIIDTIYAKYYANFVRGFLLSLTYAQFYANLTGVHNDKRYALQSFEYNSVCICAILRCLLEGGVYFTFLFPNDAFIERQL